MAAEEDVMGEPVRFVAELGQFVSVSEESGRHVASFVSDSPGVHDRAKAYRDHLNHEHRNGRVAQSTCRHGVPCDFDRVNWTPVDKAQRARLILCPDHAGKVPVAA